MTITCYTVTLHLFLTASGKQRLHSMASLVAVWVFADAMSNLQKETYPSLSQLLRWYTPLLLITTGKRLVLPGISDYLSQGRYIIHSCIVRKELTCRLVLPGISDYLSQGRYIIHSCIVRKELTCRLVLPGISDYLSQGRYIIHSCIVRKELTCRQKPCCQRPA